MCYPVESVTGDDVAIRAHFTDVSDQSVSVHVDLPHSVYIQDLSEMTCAVFNDVRLEYVSTYCDSGIVFIAGRLYNRMRSFTLLKEVVYANTFYLKGFAFCGAETSSPFVGKIEVTYENMPVRRSPGRLLDALRLREIFQNENLFILAKHASY